MSHFEPSDTSQYPSFEAFFERALKPGSRPLPPEENAVVSPADCRLVVYDSVSLSTKLWIKNHEFTLAKLAGLEPTFHTGDVHIVKDAVQRARIAKILDGHDDGPVMISRLSPLDYHRWHAPLAGEVKVSSTTV